PRNNIEDCMRAFRALPAAQIYVVACLLAAQPAAAIEVPQTREEFVRVVSEGAHGAKLETFVVERGFDDVDRAIEARTTPCLDVEIHRTGHVPYTERSSSDYNPTLRRTGTDQAEFTLQVVNRPAGVGHTPPPGGLYIMAADLRRLDASRTEIRLYHPTMG